MRSNRASERGSGRHIPNRGDDSARHDRRRRTLFCSRHGRLLVKTGGSGEVVRGDREYRERYVAVRNRQARRATLLDSSFRFVSHGAWVYRLRLLGESAKELRLRAAAREGDVQYPLCR